MNQLNEVQFHQEIHKLVWPGQPDPHPLASAMEVTPHMREDGKVLVDRGAIMWKTGMLQTREAANEPHHKPSHTGFPKDHASH